MLVRQLLEEMRTQESQCRHIAQGKLDEQERLKCDRRVKALGELLTKCTNGSHFPDREGDQSALRISIDRAAFENDLAARQSLIEDLAVRLNSSLTSWRV